jgi:DNA-binding LytR/AlgR family response regulator
MKYNCFIIDDEPLAIEVIESHLSKLDQFKVTGRFTDAVEAFVAIKNAQVDIIFLDIEMPDFNGLDFIKSMSQKPDIVVTTAYREYAVEGFELNILDYLVKPIPFERFITAIDKFLEKKKVVPPQESSTDKGYIMVRAERKHIKIELATILYIEGLKDYVKIVLSNETIITKESIGNFFKHLSQAQFIRIHKSFIVAIDKVTAITSHDIEIDKTELPIGRTYKEDLMLRLKTKGT